MPTIELDIEAVNTKQSDVYIIVEMIERLGKEQFDRHIRKAVAIKYFRDAKKPGE